MDTFTSTKRGRPVIKTRATEMTSTTRPDRQMRGLAMLDAYEQSTKDLGYDYTEKEEVPLWTRYFGKITFIIQIAILIGAAIMFGGAFTAERNGFEYSQTLRFGEIDPEILYVPYSCAGMSAVAAIVGCIGIRMRHQ